MNGILQKAPLLRQKELRPQILPQEALLMSTKNDMIVCSVDTLVDVIADMVAHALSTAVRSLPDEHRQVAEKMVDAVIDAIASDLDDALESCREVD